MRICIAAVALSLLSLSVFAQTSEPTAGKGQLKGACSADVQKFCADAPRGKGQVRACLETQAELSDTCKAAMAARTKK
jgi:Cysteine rich repeat